MIISPDHIRAQFSTAPTLVNITDLSLQTAIYFLALVRYASSGIPATHLGAIDTQAGKLAPLPEHERMLIDILFHSKLIGVSPDSSPEAFLPTGDGRISANLCRVAWIVRGRVVAPDAAAPVGVDEVLVYLFQQTRWLSHWREEIQPLWRQIAASECLAYLRQQLEEQALAFGFTQRIQKALDEALTIYSIGQTIQFLWRTVRDVVVLHKKCTITDTQCMDIVARVFAQMTRQSRHKAAEVKAFDRPWILPESSLSAVFFTEFLQLGDEAWMTTFRRATQANQSHR